MAAIDFCSGPASTAMCGRIYLGLHSHALGVVPLGGPLALFAIPSSLEDASAL